MLRQDPAVVKGPVPPLVAPRLLTSDHRLEFRRAALDSLDRSSRAAETNVAVDLGATVEVDASGLGVLVLLQKRARERGMRTRLLHVPRAVHEMLRVTRLDQLFEMAASE